MKAVQQFIAQKQSELTKHPFFYRFQGAAPFEQVMGFAPKLSFWVMVFQDLLRLNASMIADRRLRAIAQHHRQEDAGHDAWFWHDIHRLGGRQPDAHVLFDRNDNAVRDASYALISEVLHAKDDHVRTVIVLAIEATSYVFFRQVTEYVEAQGKTQDLKYFSAHHFQVEQDHDLYEDDTESEIGDVELSESIRQQALAAVTRVFAAITAMFDGLLDDATHPHPLLAVKPAAAAAMPASEW